MMFKLVALSTLFVLVSSVCNDEQHLEYLNCKVAAGSLWFELRTSPPKPEEAHKKFASRCEFYLNCLNLFDKCDMVKRRETKAYWASCNRERFIYQGKFESCGEKIMKYWPWFFESYNTVAAAAFINSGRFSHILDRHRCENLYDERTHMKEVIGKLCTQDDLLLFLQNNFDMRKEFNCERY